MLRPIHAGLAAFATTAILLYVQAGIAVFA